MPILIILFNPSSLFLVCQDKCLPLTRPTRSHIYTSVTWPRLPSWFGSHTASKGGLLLVQLRPPTLRPCCLNRPARGIRGALNLHWTCCLKGACNRKISHMFCFLPRADLKGPEQIWPHSHILQADHNTTDEVARYNYLECMMGKVNNIMTMNHKA